MTERHLQSLWRQAVLKYHKNKCFLCNIDFSYDISLLQCHHFVKRRKVFLKNDILNGFPLCHGCHLEAHTKKGEQKLIELMGKKRFNYLIDNEDIKIKDYLMENGLNRKQFNKIIAEKLKKGVQNDNTIQRS